MKLRKGQARLERRLKSYADTIKSVGVERAKGFTQPGSMKKSAPRGGR
jgi:hypothetical protein